MPFEVVQDITLKQVTLATGPWRSPQKRPVVVTSKPAS